MKKYITLIFIIILEIVISKYTYNYFSPLFTYLYIITLSSFLEKEKRISFILISGIIYDILLSTYFIHTFLFLLIDYLNRIIDKNLNKNKFITFLKFFIYIFLYRIISFIIFILIKYKEVSGIYFLESILLSLINIIFYYTLLFFYKRCVK